MVVNNKYNGVFISRTIGLIVILPCAKANLFSGLLSWAVKISILTL